jgi:hypothetical protein
VVSTPVLNMRREANVGCFLSSPISCKDIRFSRFSFGDDTDTIQTALNEYWPQVAQGLQTLMNLWLGGLKATGGAIVPRKTEWYLVDFHWNNGVWRYSNLQETPAVLHVKDIRGITCELKETKWTTP